MKEFDITRFKYSYWWIDFQAAAAYKHRKIASMEELTECSSTGKKKFRLSGYIGLGSGFTYSYNDPMTKMYFWHPAYDDYPVVGVDWKQATAFCYWRTNLMNNYLASEGDFRYTISFTHRKRNGNMQHAAETT